MVRGWGTIKDGEERKVLFSCSVEEVWLVLFSLCYLAPMASLPAVLLSVPTCAPHCGWALQAGSVSALLPACLHGEPQLTLLTSIFKWDAAGGPGSMQGGVLCQAGSCLL